MEEEMPPLWSNQESVDGLRNELLYATIRLENARMEANEEIRKNKETVSHLLHLLQTAYQERDEAKDQLHKILTKVMPSTPSELFTNSLPHFEPETPILKPNKANSSATESNSLSETYNHHSHGGSSPVDSLFDPASSPEFSNINVADSSNIMFVNQPLVQDYNACLSTDAMSVGAGRSDQASQVIDSLTKGKPLPRKGKLLQAVMEAGPLLQTLFVAGPLPQWRNPPPPQPLKVPPVSIKACDSSTNGLISQKTSANSMPFHSTSAYLGMSCGSSQMIANSMLDFTNGIPGSSLTSMPLLNPATASFSYQIPSSKRIRFQ